MAICPVCESETSDPSITTCRKESIDFPDYRRYSPVPYDGAGGPRCTGCGVGAGAWHHAACRFESCPRCDGRLMECGCLDRVIGHGPVRDRASQVAGFVPEVERPGAMGRDLAAR